MSVSPPLSLGFSPCPNDTFIFYDLVNRARQESDPLFQQPLMEDVETLNQWAFQQRLDVSKLSFHAMAHLLDDYCILSSGAALGRGCGPLLVGGKNSSLASLNGGEVAIPGEFTTAALLFKMFLPQHTRVVEMRFEQILQSVAEGSVDAGVIIHESRFTYQDLGLVCLQDLGEWWEDISGLPIPLGCIGARRKLGGALLLKIDNQIKASLQWASKHPGLCRDYIKQHAQETDDSVIDQHIDLYVNEFSLELGDEGKAAIQMFFEKGRELGVVPPYNGAIFCSRS